MQSPGPDGPGLDGGWLKVVPGPCGQVTGHAVVHVWKRVTIVLKLFSDSFLVHKDICTCFYVMTEKTEHCRCPSGPYRKKHFRLSGEDICADHSQKVTVY